MAKGTQMQAVEEEFMLAPPDDTPLEVHRPQATAKQIEKAIKSVDKPHKAGSKVKLSKETVDNVTSEVDGLMAHLKSAEVGSDEIQNIQDFVRTLGSEEINKENISSSLMEKSLGQLQKSSQGAEVASALIDLRNLVEELDPNATKNWASKLIRKVPGIGKKIDNQVKSFQSSQAQIDDIVKSLESGKRSLQEDNEAIKIERKNLWDKMGKLEQYILATEQLSSRLKEILPEVAAADPQKAKLIQSDILFYVEQRHMDLLTNLAVSMQGYMALDVVSKNNIELIKGVDRATTTTIQALKVAVMLAQALTNQQLVVEKLGAVNEITEKLLLGVSTALNENGVKIATAAMSSSVKPETLQKAFDQVVQAMDNVEKYKIEALGVMEETIKELNETTKGMKRHLDAHKEKELSGITNIIADKRKNNGISLNPTKNKLGA